MFTPGFGKQPKRENSDISGSFSALSVDREMPRRREERNFGSQNRTKAPYGGLNGGKIPNSASAFVATENLSSSVSGEIPNSDINIGTNTASSASYASYASSYIDFTYTNPTTFHCVSAFSALLQSHGFTYLSEKTDWTSALLTGKTGKFFTTRNGTALVAFTIGSDWTPKLGTGIVACHVDALTARLKPNSVKTSVHGYELLGVAPYAGALSPAWLDRDLGIAGRVLCREVAETASGERIVAHIVKSEHPVARIPSLAPHFGDVAPLPYNKETQMVPIVGFTKSESDVAQPTPDEENCPLLGRHSLSLLRHVAQLCNCKVNDIVQLELELFDMQKGQFGGFNKDFVFAPRIDDRVCAFSAINGIIEWAEADDSQMDDAFAVVALFDGEEIGSLIRPGAQGGLLQSVVARVTSSRCGAAGAASSADSAEALQVNYANSMLLSADVTHLLNPNFDSVYLERHKPVPNRGITVALDSNGHMATDGVTVAIVEEIARRNGDCLQYFQIRNDSRSGGTIGPMLSAATGIKTVDLGVAQLSMHSIRAAMGAQDVGMAVHFFRGFFDHWMDVAQSFGDL